MMRINAMPTPSVIWQRVFWRIMPKWFGAMPVTVVMEAIRVEVDSMQPNVDQRVMLTLDLEDLRDETHRLLLWALSGLAWLSFLYAAYRSPVSDLPFVLSGVLLLGVFSSWAWRHFHPQQARFVLVLFLCLTYWAVLAEVGETSFVYAGPLIVLVSSGLMGRRMRSGVVLVLMAGLAPDRHCLPGAHRCGPLPMPKPGAHKGQFRFASCLLRCGLPAILEQCLSPGVEG